MMVICRWLMVAYQELIYGKIKSHLSIGNTLLPAISGLLKLLKLLVHRGCEAGVRAQTFCLLKGNLSGILCSGLS